MSCKPIPSPYADHDHVSSKELSGQREQVRDNIITKLGFYSLYKLMKPLPCSFTL